MNANEMNSLLNADSINAIARRALDELLEDAREEDDTMTLADLNDDDFADFAEIMINNDADLISLRDNDDARIMITDAMTRIASN